MLRTARYVFAFVTIGIALAVDLMFTSALYEHRYAPYIFAIILGGGAQHLPQPVAWSER